jgi:hypothetical protein
MATLPLPKQSVRLSKVGFNKLHQQVRGDPAAAKVIADLIEADPHAALTHVFKLTSRQQEIIGKTSKKDLLKRAAPLLAALREDEPGDVRFEPDPERKAGGTGGPEHEFTCTCAFHLPFGKGRPTGSSNPPHVA